MNRQMSSQCSTQLRSHTTSLYQLDRQRSSQRTSPIQTHLQEQATARYQSNSWGSSHRSSPQSNSWRSFHRSSPIQTHRQQQATARYQSNGHMSSYRRRSPRYSTRLTLATPMQECLSSPSNEPYNVPFKTDAQRDHSLTYLVTIFLQRSGDGYCF